MLVESIFITVQPPLTPPPQSTESDLIKDQWGTYLYMGKCIMTINSFQKYTKQAQE